MKVKLITFLLVLSGMSAFGQGGKFGATPEDSVECVTQLSLYIEFFKQKNYKDAVDPWRKACSICPKSRKSLYINGAKMIKSFIKEEADEAKKEEYITELFALYRSRIEHFGDEGYVLGRLGSNMLKYHKNERKAAYDVLHKSFELQGNKSEAGTLVYYFRSMYLQVRKKEAEVDQLLAIYAPVMAVIKHNLEANAEKPKAVANWTKVKDNVNDMLSKVATCPDLLPLFKKKLEENPDDVAELKRMLKLMDKQKCTDDPFYLTVAKKLNSIEPNAESSYGIGASDAKNKNYKEAIKSFTTAYELAEDDELKAKSALQVAKCYNNSRSFQSVRSWAQKALGVNGNLGEAYLLIGQAYSASAGQCGDNECNKKGAYFAAYDKYLKAKSVDPSVSGRADQLISGVKGQFPKKEDCFFHNIKDGDALTVGCWINEQTTVRTQ